MGDNKVTLKSVDHSFSRFQLSLPGLYTQLKQHVNIIRTSKQVGNIRSLNREQISASKTFKKLKHELKELDKLENCLIASDVAKFKDTADPLRQRAYDEIVRFVELDNDLDKLDAPTNSPISRSYSSTGNALTQSTSLINTTRNVPNYGPSTQDDMAVNGDYSEPHQELMSLQQFKDNETDLKTLEETAKSWNQLQQDIQDVATIMKDMAALVHTQGEDIDTIEENVEVAKIETTLGLLELIKTRRAKFASVPFAGAAVGCLLGGPIGLLAGFKIAGVVTAVVGTYVGYRSGRYIKNKVNEDVEPVPGMLQAPTLGVYEVEGEEGHLTDDSGEFQQFDEQELSLSKSYRH